MIEKNKRLFHDFANGRISRREFISTLTTAGVSAAVIPSLLMQSAQAATPKKGGQLVIAGEAMQSKDSLDPTKFYSTTNILMGFTCYDLLVNRGPDLKPIPWLAESWESNSDASEWTFKLRKGVMFHNGKEMTADDVIYSYQRHFGEKSESPAKAYMGQITEIKKKGKYEIQVNLTSSNADFPVVLTDTRVHITQAGYEDFQSTAPGTGPFKVKDFKAGSRYVFERNDDYWGSDGPWVDEIEIVGIGDPTARVNALISGDVHVMMDLDPKIVSLMGNNSAVDVLQAKSGSFLNVALMVDRAPTNDNNLRLALKYALDREKVVNNVLKGYGSIGNDHPIAPIDPYYCTDIPQRSYDPDKARFYIKKAGLEDKIIDYYTSDVPGTGSVAAAQIYQQSAAAAGIKLNLIQPPADTYWSSVWIQKPMSASGWDARPVPDLIFSIAFQSGAAYNETAWKNERFDKIMVEARSITDFDKRKEMYCEMQTMLHDEGGHITCAFRDYIDAKRSEVKGIATHSSGPLGFYQCARTAWLDT
jgi:peptide/nickel transport system substrate-binding protein